MDLEADARPRGEDLPRDRCQQRYRVRGRARARGAQCDRRPRVSQRRARARGPRSHPRGGAFCPARGRAARSWQPALRAVVRRVVSPHARPPRRPRQQRRRHGHPAPPERGRQRDAARDQPPRALCPHRAAARPAREERAVARRQREQHDAHEGALRLGRHPARHTCRLRQGGLVRPEQAREPSSLPRTSWRGSSESRPRRRLPQLHVPSRHRESHEPPVGRPRDERLAVRQGHDGNRQRPHRPERPQRRVPDPLRRDGARTSRAATSSAPAARTTSPARPRSTRRTARSYDRADAQKLWDVSFRITVVG